VTDTLIDEVSRCLLVKSLATPSKKGKILDKKEEAMLNIEAKVKEILLEILDIQEEDIVPSAKFIHDLKATSIDIVEILTALQNTFDVNIGEAEASKIATVQDAIDHVQLALSQKQATP
jgi:acyl carrier protein